MGLITGARPGPSRRARRQLSGGSSGVRGHAAWPARMHLLRRERERAVRGVQHTVCGCVHWYYFCSVGYPYRGVPHAPCHTAPLRTGLLLRGFLRDPPCAWYPALGNLFFPRLHRNSIHEPSFCSAWLAELPQNNFPALLRGKLPRGCLIGNSR